MKFVVSNTDLLSHLQALSKAIPSKPQFPIMTYFLFDLKGTTLELRVSGGDTIMSCQLELETVSQEGAMAVPGKFILDMLSTFAGSEQPLTFDMDETTSSIVIYSENGQYTFVGSSSMEFPTLPPINESMLTTFDLDSSVINNGFSATLFATGEDEYRPVMSGVLVEFSGQAVTFVSSDAHKLVRYRYQMPEGEQVPETGSFIVHKKPAALLKGLLAKGDGKVNVSFDDKHVIFHINEYTLISALIPGRFPNYNSVIPQYNPNVVTIDRTTFLRALSRIQVFASQSILLVTIKLSGNQMTLQSQDTDTATAGKEMLRCQYEGQEMTIGFKAQYLIEILSNLASSEIQLQLSDPARPGLLVPVGSTEDQAEDVLMLLMPMMH